MFIQIIAANDEPIYIRKDIILTVSKYKLTSTNPKYLEFNKDIKSIITIKKESISKSYIDNDPIVIDSSIIKSKTNYEDIIKKLK